MSDGRPGRARGVVEFDGPPFLDSHENRLGDEEFGDRGEFVDANGSPNSSATPPSRVMIAADTWSTGHSVRDSRTDTSGHVTRARVPAGECRTHQSSSV